METKFTYGDLDRLRNAPDRPGPYQKLWNHTFGQPIDAHRVRKFCRTLARLIAEYESELAALGRKYGRGDERSFRILPDKFGEYQSDKKALDAVECRELAATLVPLPFATWSQVPLSASDLDALEKFVEGYPEPQVAAETKK